MSKKFSDRNYSNSGANKMKKEIRSCIFCKFMDAIEVFSYDYFYLEDVTGANKNHLKKRLGEARTFFEKCQRRGFRYYVIVH